MSTRNLIRNLPGLPTSDGAGVKLTRLIGQPMLDMLDPFLLLDAFGSERGTDYIAGFPEHPHRGFETVTYMLAGRMRHRDNQGNSGLLVAGGAQWMTAGAGLIHSEMPEQSDGEMRGFQLWVNLPATHKMIAPRYQDIAPEQIPVLTPAAGASVRLIAGEVFGARGPVQGILTQPLFVDIALAASATLTLTLPAAHTAFVHAFEGAGVQVGDTWLAAQELGVLGAGEQIELRAADAPTRLILVAAAPLREPVARYGPFVMNTPQQIQQALADYRAGRI
ncbi:pirin family protein [Metallibacterium sp.]|jgi:hypothetical protein|uniref:pirin family protein n=1 Tax=Metallibacterium sp. TaxID=2940281 RepID=UPI0026151198|nr:pirin family protein [Metallibacterium sp.]